jgi:hypothetical protein
MQDSRIYFIYIIFPIETTGYILETFLTVMHGIIIFNALTMVHFILTLYYIPTIIPVIFTVKYCSSLISSNYNTSLVLKTHRR